MITIYSDGASRGNPGPGGYGAILIFGTLRKELSEGFRLTTNNRMELLGVIAALEALKKEETAVTVYSDSKYVVDSVEKKWVFGWEKKNFKEKKNSDLWIRFLAVYRKHKVKFVWVKGHHTNKENNRCDELAVAAAQGKDLKPDVGYEIERKKEDANLL
ncbi:MAG: ribonuclease HI [Bacteroidota bacterium]